MTREEIREIIDTYTDDGCLYFENDCGFRNDKYCVSDEASYQCLMKRLDELGVVIKVVLPFYTMSDVLVEPLIKE